MSKKHVKYRLAHFHQCSWAPKQY